MNPELDAIESIINGFSYAKDKDRVFTYIEFVKMFGYENNPNLFISVYKDYVTRWATIKKHSIQISDTDFVFAKLVEILKSITLDYSSYEEQDFIAHINLNNKAHIKALSSLYSRKIREITEFYRKKRNESVLVVNRNSIKGSTKSVQEIIYEKVFDFIFSNKNIVPSYKNIKRDLLVTVEQYVDTYSEYFDIPRQQEFTDQSRAEMLSANINQVDYRVYLEIELVVSEILFSGNVMLEEIPLIAQLGLDLSQNCVGDLLALKNSLVANTTINQVDLNEQVALKRRLYEKFLGCDLWYMYVDLQGNVTMDVLCKAKNPTGNLLNCGSPDTATIPSGKEQLLSHIGLFFKPDKTSILKINAKDYTWSIDTDNLIKDTVYIFPDPNKYGDIGNNKDNNYPLIMEYRTDWDVRNLSSGTAVDDPLMYITDQGWRSYYSKQDDDFKQIKNLNWEYSFTFLSNKGFLSQYQKDIWGNEFGLLKGCEVSTTTKEVIDENGDVVEKTVPKITLVGNGFTDDVIFAEAEELVSKPKIINGGYFEHPLYPGKEEIINGKKVWTFKGEEDKCRPFDYIKKQIINKNYRWSGLEVYGIPHYDDKTLDDNAENIEEFIKFSPSVYDVNFINFGNFGDADGIVYEDHYGVVSNKYADIIQNNDVIFDVLEQFVSVNLLENPEKADFVYEAKEATYEEIKQMDGELYIKYVGNLDEKPIKFRDVFHWIPNIETLKVYSFKVYNDNVIIETDEDLIFIPYSYDGTSFTNTLGVRKLLRLPKNYPTKVLFVEQDRMFYILQLKEWKGLGNNRLLALPHIFKFDPINYTLSEIINPFDGVYKTKYENEKLSRVLDFELNQTNKWSIISNGALLKSALNSDEWNNFLDFEIPQYDSNGYGELAFTYNSALGTYLISYVLMDESGTPYIYEHKFKMTSLEDFESSLKTNVYTLKSLTFDEDSGELNDVYWVKNSTLDGGTMSSYPYGVLANSSIFNETNLVYDYQTEDFGGNFNQDVNTVNYNYSVSHSINSYGENIDAQIITEQYSYETVVNLADQNDSDFVFSNELNNNYTYNWQESISQYDTTFNTSVALESFTYNTTQESVNGYNTTFNANANTQTFTYNTQESVNGYDIAFEVNSQTFTYSQKESVNGYNTAFNAEIPSATIVYDENGEIVKNETDLSELVQGSELFRFQGIKTFNVDLPKVKQAQNMFEYCENLTSFNGDLSSLFDGYEMFSCCENLTSFNGGENGLKELLTGDYMFYWCKLDKNSVLYISNNIKDIYGMDVNDNTLWNGISTSRRGKLYLGIDSNIENDAGVVNAIEAIRLKGWDVTVYTR